MSRSKCLLNLTDSFRYFLLNCIEMGPPFRVKELLQSKQSDLPTRSSSNEEDQTQLQVKRCGTYSAESAKALQKCPEIGSMTKVLDGNDQITEPVMEMVFKKPRLSNTGITPPEAVRKPGISCSLYQAVKAPPSNQDIGSFKARLNEENSQYGLSLYTSTTTGKSVPTNVGQAPLGSYLSYQLAPTEGDFSVSHNMIFPRSQSTQM